MSHDVASSVLQALVEKFCHSVESPEQDAQIVLSHVEALEREMDRTAARKVKRQIGEVSELVTELAARHDFRTIGTVVQSFAHLVNQASLGVEAGAFWLSNRELAVGMQPARCGLKDVEAFLAFLVEFDALVTRVFGLDQKEEPQVISHHPSFVRMSRQLFERLSRIETMAKELADAMHFSPLAPTAAQPFAPHAKWADLLEALFGTDYGPSRREEARAEVLLALRRCASLNHMNDVAEQLPQVPELPAPGTADVLSIDPVSSHAAQRAHAEKHMHYKAKAAAHSPPEPVDGAELGGRTEPPPPAAPMSPEPVDEVEIPF